MLDGILNIYKEKGYTSHDVVARMRGILKQKKIGHTGTLDPAAEGVLPVCLGQATKLCDMLTDQGKTYRAVLLLGTETDTQDMEGKLLYQTEVSVTEQQVREAVLSFQGDYDQVPPMYSALKVEGRRLYDLARQGIVVERKARRVVIHEIALRSVELPWVTMTVHCSKGTYIRTLCHDIGQKLGCGGCMESLVRTQAGPFVLEDSLTLARLEQLQDQGELESHMTSMEQLLSGLPPAKVRPQWDRLVHNGNPIGPEQAVLSQEAREGTQYRLYDSKGVFLGIYVYQSEKHWLKPQKMFLGGQTG